MRSRPQTTVSDKSWGHSGLRPCRTAINVSGIDRQDAPAITERCFKPNAVMGTGSVHAKSQRLPKVQQCNVRDWNDRHQKHTSSSHIPIHIGCLDVLLSAVDAKTPVVKGHTQQLVRAQILPPYCGPQFCAWDRSGARVSSQRKRILPPDVEKRMPDQFCMRETRVCRRRTSDGERLAMTENKRKRRVVCLEYKQRDRERHPG